MAYDRVLLFTSRGHSTCILPEYLPIAVRELHRWAIAPENMERFENVSSLSKVSTPTILRDCPTMVSWGRVTRYLHVDRRAASTNKKYGCWGGQPAPMQKQDTSYFASWRISWRRASLVPRGMQPQSSTVGGGACLATGVSILAKLHVFSPYKPMHGDEHEVQAVYTAEEGIVALQPLGLARGSCSRAAVTMLWCHRAIPVRA